MSTDDFGDRTQRPTDRRRREARARGEVARSADLVCAVVLLSTTAALWWMGPSLGSELASLMRAGLVTVPSSSTDPEMIAAQLVQIAMRLSSVVLPILLVAIAAAAAANLLQTGFLWLPTAIAPQFDRLNPAKGFARWLAIPSWIGLVMSLIKLVALLAVLLIYVRRRLASGGPLITGSPPAIVSVAGGLVTELAMVLSVSLATLAILDYGYQFWRQERQLMMTIEEVRRERREDNGDPDVKRRQRGSNSSTTTRPVDLDVVNPA